MKTYMYVNLMLAEALLLKTTDYGSVRSKTGLSGTSPLHSCRRHHSWVEWLRAACKHFLPCSTYLPASWTHMVYKCIPCITVCWPFTCIKENLHWNHPSQCHVKFHEFSDFKTTYILSLYTGNAFRSETEWNYKATALVLSGTREWNIQSPGRCGS